MPARAAMNTGATEVLMRPVGDEVLIAAIQAAFGQSEDALQRRAAPQR